MKKTIILISILTIFVGCKTTKKNSVTDSTTSTQVITETPAGPGLLLKSSDGIYPPGEAELTAIQVKYKEATLAQLQEGHTLYTKGACTNCHGPKNIYRYNELAWKDIIDDMALKAQLSALEKDAVSKYVFAIKAKQP